MNTDSAKHDDGYEALMARRKQRAESAMRNFDKLDRDGKRLVHQYGQGAQDRILALGMTPEDARRDLIKKYGEAVRT